MCLAAPGKIIKINNSFAETNFGGVTRKISIALTPEAKKGDYILAHAGFAIQILKKKDAAETLKLFDSLYSYKK